VGKGLNYGQPYRLITFSTYQIHVAKLFAEDFYCFGLPQLKLKFLALYKIKKSFWDRRK